MVRCAIIREAITVKFFEVNYSRVSRGGAGTGGIISIIERPLA
jgi:hypothetical protein